MKSDFRCFPDRGRRRSRRGLCRLAASLVPALAAAALLVGCAAAPPSGGAPADPAMQRTEPEEDLAAVDAALEYHGLVSTLGAAELAHQRMALNNAPGTPLVLVRQAILLSQPNGAANIPRALALLGAVAAQGTPEAIALHPLVRLLSDQLLERQRLEATAARLTQQLERAGQQLKDSQRLGEQLQEKLEALTEIERTLPAPPTASPSSPPPTSPRRPPR